MLGEVVLETPRMSLWFHPEDLIVRHEMHQYPGRETLEKVLLRGLDLLKEHGASKWLSDDRNSGALPRSHHEWGVNVWAPQAVAAGWKYWALLPPEEAIGHSNMARLKETYAAMGTTVEIFSDVPTAYRWLCQADVPAQRLADMPAGLSKFSR